MSKFIFAIIDLQRTIICAFIFAIIFVNGNSCGNSQDIVMTNNDVTVLTIFASNNSVMASSFEGNGEYLDLENNPIIETMNSTINTLKTENVDLKTQLNTTQTQVASLTPNITNWNISIGAGSYVSDIYSANIFVYQYKIDFVLPQLQFKFPDAALGAICTIQNLPSNILSVLPFCNDNYLIFDYSVKANALFGSSVSISGNQLCFVKSDGTSFGKNVTIGIAKSSFSCYI